jgi:hypothetical protein
VSIGQRLIEIVRESGLIGKTDVYTFANGPRAPNTSYNAVDDGLYMSTETPQSRRFVSKTGQGYYQSILA